MNVTAKKRAVYIDDVEFLLDQTAFTTHGMAARLHVHRLSIYTVCRRADRLDLWERMRINESGERKAS